MNRQRSLPKGDGRLHVRSRHFRTRLLDLLAEHYRVRLDGTPDAATWQTIAQLVQDRTIYLQNTSGRAILAVRGPSFKRPTVPS